MWIWGTDYSRTSTRDQLSLATANTFNGSDLNFSTFLTFAISDHSPIFRCHYRRKLTPQATTLALLLEWSLIREVSILVRWYFINFLHQQYGQAHASKIHQSLDILLDKAWFWIISTLKFSPCQWEISIFGDYVLVFSGFSLARSYRLKLTVNMINAKNLNAWAMMSIHEDHFRNFVEQLAISKRSKG